MLECQIRDLISENMEEIESGLKLITKEKYIPKSIMTKSFIDLLAQDKNGNWVIIEIKRENSSAREAIHEVFKYIGAVKAHFMTRDDEIRVIVISTHWDELIGPYSKFVEEASYNISGLKLNIGKDGLSLAYSPVEPAKIERGRIFAPWHGVNFYKNQESLNQGIAEYRENYNKKNLEYYVLIVLRAPEGLHERQMEVTRLGLESIVGKRSHETGADCIDEIMNKIDSEKFMLYCAHKHLSDTECLEILKDELYLYASDFDDLEGEERSLALHEHCFALEPRPHCDRYEIGYPAKFSSRFLENEGWRMQSILRGGSLSRNHVLQDSEIISELSGYTGTSWQRFKRRITFSNKAQLALARSEIKACLSNNPAWQQNILHHFDEISSQHSNCSASISIHNPTSGLFTLYFAATRADGVLYVPTYTIIVDDNNIERMYYGHLIGAPTSMSIGAVLKKFYDDDLFGLLLTASSGYYEPRDSEILEEIGLVYSSFRFDRFGGERNFFELKNGRWRQISELVPFASFFDFLSGSDKLVYSLVRKISFRINNGIVNADSATDKLDGFCDEQRASLENNIITDAPEKCDMCNIFLDGEKYFIDGKTRMYKVWAYLCVDCFNEEGAGIGWGTGQLYRRNSHGAWMQVSGFRPLDDLE